jgi:hypothetical protein
MEGKFTLANDKESVSPLAMLEISVSACAILPNQTNWANVKIAPVAVAIERKHFA